MSAKQCLFVGIFILLSLSVVMGAPPAVHPTTGEPLVIDCLRGTPDAIDGDLSDWKLGALVPAVLDKEEQLYTGQGSWDGPDDCSGEFYFMWDDTYIYMAVIVKDDTLSMNKTDGDIWNADCVEMFFATTETATDHAQHYQYGFNANDQTWNWCNMDSAGQSAIDYLQCASSITADGYICEAAIEYSKMAALDFTPGNTIGLHPCIDDTDAADREGQITWTGREAHDQSLGFGYLVLSDAAITPGYSSGPNPSNGAMVMDTWVSMSWRAGMFAASHDVYLGDNFVDVNEATRDSEFFRGNQTSTFYIAGFPGYAYPDGLVPGTTYYWRIDEVNAPPDETVYKGTVWNFSLPPQTAYTPDPADGAQFVGPGNVMLTWTPGYGAKLHHVYLSDNRADVEAAAPAAYKGARGLANFSAGNLASEKVYYWRVDEFDGLATHPGDIWMFTTPGAVGNPQPEYKTTDAGMNAILSWTASASAASHQVYFGTDMQAVLAAGAGSPEYKGSKALGAESYDPGLLDAETTYYWRVDEVNGQGNVATGPVWIFTTGAYLLVDDFESYTDNDADGEAIWQTWVDGFGIADNGAQVGYLMPPYAEQKVIHGGTQSLPLLFENVNGVKNSEASLTLTAPRDWTAAGVSQLSLWYQGKSANAADPMYVAISNSAGAAAIVANSDPLAAQAHGWRQWVIPLQDFADQGINLSNVSKLAIGVGNKAGAAAPGGSGTVFIDDIRLSR
jgi:hypothetical protein